MRFIRLNEKNIVTLVRTGNFPLEGEIESEVGQIGQRMLEEGTFVDVPFEPIESDLTIEERILVETQYQTLLLEMNSIF